MISDKAKLAHRKDFLHEIHCLKEVQAHPNILQLIGVVKDEPGTILVFIQFLVPFNTFDTLY